MKCTEHKKDYELACADCREVFCAICVPAAIKPGSCVKTGKYKTGDTKLCSCNRIFIPINPVSCLPPYVIRLIDTIEFVPTYLTVKGRDM